MRIELSVEEGRYLLCKLQLDIEYYRTLARSARCGPLKREKWELVRGLGMKLGMVLEQEKAA